MRKAYAVRPRGAVTIIRRECLGCHGIDHRGRERLDADKAIHAMYQIVEVRPDFAGEPIDRHLGYVCTEACIKRADANPPKWNQWGAKF